VRSWPETAARLEAGWARLPVALDPLNTGWHWDTTQEIWIGPMDGRQ